MGDAGLEGREGLTNSGKRWCFLFLQCPQAQHHTQKILQSRLTREIMSRNFLFRHAVQNSDRVTRVTRRSPANAAQLG
jgi:hypothetical protein